MKFEITIGSRVSQFEGTQADLWPHVSSLLTHEPAGTIPHIAEVATAAPAPKPAPIAAPQREIASRPIVATPPARVESAPIRGVTVDAAGAARVAADLAMAREAGFAPAKPLYAPGTMVVDAGVDNARASRAEFDDMPVIHDALSEVSTHVRAEKRTDVTIETGKLRMDSKGRIVLPSGERLLVEPAAWGDLCRDLGIPSAGAYLSACEPELRARNVNQWTSGWQNPWESKALVLRTRDASDGRAVFASVSSGYTAYDADSIADRLRAQLPSDARGTVVYDGRNVQADVLWHSDIRPDRYVAGEIFKAGLRFRSSDTGGGSLNGSALLWRNLCLNLIILDVSKVGLFRLSHLGDRRRFAHALAQGVSKGLQATAAFRDQWDTASQDRLTAPGHVVHASDGRKAVPTESLTDLLWGAFLHEARTGDALKRAEVPALVRAWQVEPDATRVGLVNAMTRHAQSVGTSRADEIERRAGQILRDTRPIKWAPPETRDRNAIHAA